MDIKSNLNLCSGKITLPNLGEDYRLRVYTCGCNYSIFNLAFSEGVCCDHLTFDVGPDSYCIRNSCNYIGANSFGITTCAPHIELQSYCINFTSLPFWSGSSGDEIAEKQLVPREYVDNAVDSKNGFCYVDPDGMITENVYYSQSPIYSEDISGIKFPGSMHHIVGNNNQMVVRGGNLTIWGCCTLNLCSNLDTYIESSTDLTICSGCRINISTSSSGNVSEFNVSSRKICLAGTVTAYNLTVGCTSVFTCDSTFGDNAVVTFGCAPHLTNVNNLTETQLVPKSYVDNATATKFSCTYTDTEEHTISIDSKGLCFSPEKIQIHGCGGSLVIGGESDDSIVVFDLDAHFSKVPFVSAPSLCLIDGFGSAYFATEAYVDARINPEFEEGLKIGKGACVVDVSTDEDVIVFNETELPTTGGTVATQDYVEESIKSLPYTCIYNLGECTPVNGIASWEITLMCGDQYVASIIPPHVSILKNDSSTTLGGIYVNADVSVNIMDDVGIPYETRIKIEMNTTETIPANTFKAIVSNIYARCF